MSLHRNATRFAASLGLAVLLVVVAAGPALATGVEPRDLVVLSGRADVPRGRVVRTVVVFHGLATIEGVARGDVVVVDGRAVVTGQVSGSVVNLGGPVVVEGSAQIRGDVIARGGAVVRSGAQISGSVSSRVPFSLGEALGVFGMFAAWLAVSLSMLMLGLLLLWLFPGASERVAEAGRRSPWRSSGMGVALFVGLPVACIFLLASVVGAPLGFALVLALGLLFMAGATWAAWVLGRALLQDRRGRILTFLLGWAILRALGAIPWAGGVTWLLSAVFGLGAMIVALWRARRAGAVAAEEAPSVETWIGESGPPAELWTPATSSGGSQEEESSGQGAEPSELGEQTTFLPETRRSDRHR
jgi:hypothetical protein